MSPVGRRPVSAVLGVPTVVRTKTSMAFDVRVSGVFRIGDVDGFIYSLREALGVQAHESIDEIVLMRSDR